MIGLSCSFEVDNILLTLRLQLVFRRGVFFTWTIYDCNEADATADATAEEEATHFYRPESLLGLDERFRRAG